MWIFNEIKWVNWWNWSSGERRMKKKKKFESQVRVRVWDFWLLNSDQGFRVHLRGEGLAMTWVVLIRCGDVLTWSVRNLSKLKDVFGLD